ncbi:hypothetical protein H6F89_03430 [Cyanobacteria bacterium FACHB-63]|nr:hypothetical protein [Cyanobacteria bacterium FACHB-63]
MYKEEKIQALFGNDALVYLMNKHQGGSSNEKGNTYENFFAVYQLACLARDALEEGKSIQVLSQILAFVDDLIISNQADNYLRHYQLKNSPTVTWGTGLKSLADDFKKQYDLNTYLDRQSDLNLVVSCQKVQQRLSTHLPAGIKPYSQVLYFPFAPNLPQILQQKQDFQEAIRYLSAFENPAPDKIECVASVLLGAWVAHNRSSVSVIALLEKAQECSPCYIRCFNQDLQLDSEVVKILGKIDGFTYNLAKGFLHWKFSDGLEEGTYPHSIETTHFMRFQTLIKKQQPTAFEELEDFLV